MLLTTLLTPLIIQEDNRNVNRQFRVSCTKSVDEIAQKLSCNSTSMKIFWVILERYTLIQTEKFQTGLHDTNRKTLQEYLTGHEKKKFEPISFLESSHYFELFQLSWNRALQSSTTTLRAIYPDRRIQLVSVIRNPCTACRPTGVCGVGQF